MALHCKTSELSNKIRTVFTLSKHFKENPDCYDKYNVLHLGVRRGLTEKEALELYNNVVKN